MKLIRKIERHGRTCFEPIFRLDRSSGRIFWDPNEIPRLSDRIRSEERQAALARRRKDKHRPRRR